MARRNSMPGSLISLCELERFFRVQYGDFVTILMGDGTEVAVELRKSHRLHYAILVTAGASMEKFEWIDDPFGEGALYPDEPTEYSQCRLPVNGANCAALLATGFCWTSEAAGAANEYRVSATVVEQIREASEELHRESERLCERLWSGRGETDHLTHKEFEAQHEQVDARYRGRVNWQAMAAEEYKIPPEFIVASPRAETKKRRKWWRLWKAP
jgi:hypothetical protein